MNRSRITGDLVSQNNIFVDIANDRVGIGSTIPGQKLSLPDNANIALGNSADLRLYHDGNNSYVRSNATNSQIIIRSPFVTIQDGVGNNQLISRPEAEVELKYDGSQRFETTAYGVTVTGTTDTDGLIVSGVSTVGGAQFFSKTDYAATSSENFYRIKLQEHGGIMNDVGIGQQATGCMGFNILPGGHYSFNNGTDGETMRLNQYGNLTLTSTNTDANAGPEFKLYRTSSSPADADYIGQVKFAGLSDTGVERNYAKITGKILDASNGTEDGILEFAHIKNGTQTITGRWRSDSLQLLNSTNFSVAGTSEFTGTSTFTGSIDANSTLEVAGVANFDSTVQIADTIEHLGDTNTKIRFPDADTFSVETGGSEAFRINQFGQVGINTSVGGQLAIAMDSSNTNPLATGFIAISLKNTNTTDNTSVCMDFNNSVGGIVGRFGAQFKDTSDKDTDLYFATREDGGALAERMRITKQGRVGIGEDSPESGLHITAGNDRSAIRLENTFPSTNNVWELQPGISGVTNTGFCIRDIADNANRFVIDGSGRVGINQSSPTAELEVAPDGSNTTSTIFIHTPTHNTNAQSEAVLKFGYGHSGDPDGVGHIKMVEDANNSFDADFIFGLPINNNSGGSVTNERVRITSEGQIRVQGTYNGSSSTSNTFPVLNVTNLQGSYTAGNILGGVSFGKVAGHTNGIRAGVLALYSDTGSQNGNVGTSLVFRTASESAGDSNEKMRIHSDGKISMGSDETSTGLLLIDKNITAESDVSDKNNYHLVIRSKSDSNTSKIGIAFANTSNATHVGAAILHHRETTDSVGSLAFYTSPSSGTTTERFRITRYGELGLSGANFGTNGQVLTSQGSGQPAEWRTIVQAPVISSITGNIFANSSGNSLTLTGLHFGTGQGTVNFSGGSLNPSKNVNVTPTSDTSLTVTIPSDVANNVNSGETITIKFTNASGLIGSGTNTTVLALPSGGSITTSGNFRIHTFTSSGNFVLTKSITIEYLVVAGGGGGGGNDGGQDFSGGSGGGGAGGYRTGSTTPSASTHTITVGGGGSGNLNQFAGSNGSNSAFGSIVSTGGGGGGGVNNAGSNGQSGGSGGGSGQDDSNTTFSGGSGTSGQGNAGGGSDQSGGGGGGGAGGAGGAGNGHQGGDGGAGASSSITGSAVNRAGGGGGGGGASATTSTGGTGGGGAGASRNTSNAVAGTVNTGSGGGGAADSNVSSEADGANGGSGIVILRYNTTTI